MNPPKASNHLHPCTQQKGSIKKNLLIILLVSMLLIAFTISMLPQGYPSDTTKIGKGKPAIVIVYDGENGLSDELMGSFSKVRGEFEASIEFILVDIEAPGGRAFVKANAAPTSSALFFDGKGERLTAIHTPLEADLLSKSIRQIFGF